MKLKLFAAGLLLMPAAASAQSMNAQVFFKRATALQKKGVLAVFSGAEIKALMSEGQAAGKAAGAAYDAANGVGAFAAMVKAVRWLGALSWGTGLNFSTHCVPGWS